MNMDDVAHRGLVLLGCGKMGSAMLAGWLKSGLPATVVWVNDPFPSDWLKAQGVHREPSASLLIQRSFWLR
jgi:pyrroline-5-carboxylate reductase